MDKMAITAYISIITLDVNGLNAPNTRHMDKADVVHTYNGILHVYKKK